VKASQMAIPFLHDRPLVIDLFAGGGGASLGVEWALGYGPDVAINHDPIAVAVHAANHPRTHHRCESVFASAPKDVCRGRRVGMLWASPDCTHHSHARGGKPRDSGKRSLADAVLDWAREVRPDVILAENVREFADWGPLGEDGKPDPLRKGDDFRAWVAGFEALGYRWEMREIRAHDFGAPTSRNRLYIIFRCDGGEIVWPSPTHGPSLSPYRTAAECIDFSIPCPSIFLTKDEARDLGLTCKRPLVEATMARIGRGVWTEVINAAGPFVVDGAARTMVQTGYGERPGQAPRTLDIHAPMGTVVGCGVKQAVVATFLAKHYSDRPTGGWAGSAPLDKSFGTITARDHHALVTSNLLVLRNNADGRPLAEQMPTIAAQGNHIGEVRAFLIKYYGTGVAASLRESIDTVTSRDTFGLVMVDGWPYFIADIGMRMLIARELFRGQSFPDSYIIDILINGLPISKEAQVRLAGNSVCPVVARALVAANCNALIDRHALEAA
jgi:DNA (cytosine-5)-methyltransferase 1